MRADPRGPAPAEAPPLNRWFGRPELDEVGLRWARPAHHVQRGIARGGLLFMTEDKLGFQPRGIDALFGARAMSWDLSTMTDVHLKPSLRKLRVTVTTDSGRHRFIVTNALVVFNDLRAWRQGQSGSGVEGGTGPEGKGGTPS